MTTISRTALLAAILLAGCGDDDTCDNCPPKSPGQETPTRVVESLVFAWEEKEVEACAPLLAEDFRFVFDARTRPLDIPVSWTRLEDSTATGHLFLDPEVRDIRISLTYGLDTPVVEAGRESWRKIVVTDTFLEIDLEPAGYEETVTFRVDGDHQEFYLRQGRSPADTLASSPTAQLWYLVEWRDLGREELRAAATWPLTSDPASWGAIKARYR